MFKSQSSQTLKPLKLQQCTLHFRNLQSLFIWTREVKSIAAFSVHNFLSGIYLGLLHKIENVCKHAKETVSITINSIIELTQLHIHMNSPYAFDIKERSSCQIFRVLKRNRISWLSRNIQGDKNVI